MLELIASHALGKLAALLRLPHTTDLRQARKVPIVGRGQLRRHADSPGALRLTRTEVLEHGWRQRPRHFT